MEWAIVADIHGNLEALETAEAFIGKRKIKNILCLGDSVGYGANPNQCLEWSLKHCKLHVLGNHEAAVVQEKIRWSFNDWARIAIDWTADHLRPELINKIKNLPYLQIEGSLTIAHGTIHDPERFEYLMDDIAIDRSFRVLKTAFGLVGHSHIPSCFSKKEPEKGGYLKPGVIKLKEDDSYLLNPGSIGQPRDRDPRLSFGILDTDELTFEIVRLDYDNTKAANKIRAEGLPAMLADRLL